MNPDTTRHMNWEGGVDLVACTEADLPMPNVIVHLARRVTTPAGSAPAGMVLWQPDPDAPPALMGFVSPDPKVAAYFGPAIFAGTPFEKAPAIEAGIRIAEESPGVVSAHVNLPGYIFDVTLRGLGPVRVANRAPSDATPFHQQTLEAEPSSVELKVNGAKIPVIVPRIGISGGPAAVWAPAGIYSR